MYEVVEVCDWVCVKVLDNKLLALPADFAIHTFIYESVLLCLSLKCSDLLCMN